MGNPGDCTTTATCPFPDGFLSFPPSLAGSFFFLSAFAILIPVNFFSGIRYHTPLYSSTIMIGLLFEVIGYAGRLLLSSDVASIAAFVLYMLGTMLGPAFFVAAVYQILPHILVLYGKEFSPVSQPVYLVIISVALDLLTVAFQAAGVGFAVMGGTQEEKSQGMYTLIAGLGIQLASITLFFAIYWYFVYSLHHRRYILDPTFREVYLSAKFKIFLLCMQLSTFLLLLRTTIRLASLLPGFNFTSILAQSQIISLLLDGALVLIACLILTFVPVGAAFSPQVWKATSPLCSPSFFDSETPVPLRAQRHAPGPGHTRNISPPFPTPMPRIYGPRAPPYRPPGVPPPRPPRLSPKGSPGFVVTPRSSPGYGLPPYEVAAGGYVVMTTTPGPSPGLASGHRRGQGSVSRDLVESQVLW